MDQQEERRVKQGRIGSWLLPEQLPEVMWEEVMKC